MAFDDNIMISFDFGIFFYVSLMMGQILNEIKQIKKKKIHKILEKEKKQNLE